MNISNINVNKIILVTFAIYCCAIIRNIFINLLHIYEHGHYWPIWDKKAIRQNSNFILLYKLNSLNFKVQLHYI